MPHQRKIGLHWVYSISYLAVSLDWVAACLIGDLLQEFRRLDYPDGDRKKWCITNMHWLWPCHLQHFFVVQGMVVWAIYMINTSTCCLPRYYMDLILLLSYLWKFIFIRFWHCFASHIKGLTQFFYDFHCISMSIVNIHENNIKAFVQIAVKIMESILLGWQMAVYYWWLCQPSCPEGDF